MIWDRLSDMAGDFNSEIGVSVITPPCGGVITESDAARVGEPPQPAYSRHRSSPTEAAGRDSGPHRPLPEPPWPAHREGGRAPTAAIDALRHSFPSGGMPGVSCSSSVLSSYPRSPLNAITLQRATIPKGNVMPSRPDSKLSSRVSLDLDKARYRGLQRFCYEAAEELNVPKVAQVDVLRALLTQLQEEPYLRKQIISRL